LQNEASIGRRLASLIASSDSDFRSRQINMKQFIGLALVAAATLTVAPAAVLPLQFTDAFDRAEGSLFTVSPGLWDVSGSAAGPELMLTNPAALTAPGGFTPATGKGVKWTPSGSARRCLVQFTSVSSGTLYASFLLNVLTSPSSGSRLVAYFDSSTSQPSSPQLGFFVGNGAVGVGKKSSAPGATISIGSGTHLIVVRYTFTGTSADEVDLWVDPSSTTYGAVDAPPPSGSTSGGNNVAAIPYFGLYAASGAGPSLYIDEIRLGTNWSHVTPPDGGIVPGTPSVPVITQALLSASNFILRGTNGTPGGGYEVISTSSIGGSWSTVCSNTFTGAGTFDSTNPINPALNQAYFRLRAGGSGGSSNPPAGTPPTIISQPQNQSAAIGQGALFSVGATGSTPFSYQWYFNSNTPIPDATNQTHALSSVTSNNAGAYHVIVANSAGYATSTVATLTIATAPTNGNWFVSTTGSDANPGTLALPFATLGRAASVAQPGHVIYLRGGTYLPDTTIRITNSGTAGNRISLLAYPGEKPYLNFVNQPYGANNRGILFPTNANHWNVKGLEIGYAGDNGIKVEGSHLRFEECVFHHNGDTGLQVGFGHDDVNPGGLLAAFVEVINCDSYLNYDSDSNGGDADGFAAKMHCGQGIVFMGCRAWENSDDGWDLFETDYSVIISNCWTWKSGVGQGNGNGFKLGGDGAGGNSMGTHYALNCVSFSHKVNCFTQNSHRDGLVIQHCLAFAPGNSGYNYFMEGTLNSGKQNIFRIPRSGTNGGGFIEDNNPIQENNTWNLSVTANSADYVSIAEAAAKAPRLPDGSLPLGFARLVSGSDLTDKGVNVGLPFNGAAPDLGPYEY
jgi:hypothetical protein